MRLLPISLFLTFVQLSWSAEAPAPTQDLPNAEISRVRFNPEPSPLTGTLVQEPATVPVPRILRILLGKRGRETHRQAREFIPLSQTISP
jgi:hypothetical protein